MTALALSSCGPTIVPVARLEHCKPVQGPALSGDGALDARSNVAFIAPALFDLKRRKNLKLGRSVERIQQMRHRRDAAPSRLFVAALRSPAGRTRTRQEDTRRRTSALDNIVTRVTRSLTLSALSLDFDLSGSHQVVPGSNHIWVTGLSQVGIVPDENFGWRVFPGISRFPPPFRSGSTPYSPQPPSLTVGAGERERESEREAPKSPLHPSLSLSRFLSISRQRHRPFSIRAYVLRATLRHLVPSFGINEAVVRCRSLRCWRNDDLTPVKMRFVISSPVIMKIVVATLFFERKVTTFLLLDRDKCVAGKNANYKATPRPFCWACHSQPAAEGDKAFSCGVCDTVAHIHAGSCTHDSYNWRGGWGCFPYSQGHPSCAFARNLLLAESDGVIPLTDCTLVSSHRLYLLIAMMSFLSPTVHLFPLTDCTLVTAGCTRAAPLKRSTRAWLIYVVVHTKLRRPRGLCPHVCTRRGTYAIAAEDTPVSTTYSNLTTPFSRRKYASHTARVSLTCLRDVNMFPLPARSPDLPSIENVRDKIGRRLWPSATKEDLEGKLCHMWQALPQGNIQRLYASMTDRISSCFHATGVAASQPHFYTSYLTVHHTKTLSLLHDQYSELRTRAFPSPLTRVPSDQSHERVHPLSSTVGVACIDWGTKNRRLRLWWKPSPALVGLERVAYRIVRQVRHLAPHECVARGKQQFYRVCREATSPHTRFPGNSRKIPHISKSKGFAGTPRFSHVGSVQDDAAGRRVYSGISRFAHPCILARLHSHPIASSSALKTSLLELPKYICNSPQLLVTHVAITLDNPSRTRSKSAGIPRRMSEESVEVRNSEVLRDDEGD
ncbi:hypothetical protein PR048_016389 [Dryococelus australis]|uniref:Uncharacterized protein n=1 Tax=Dryococelus australis TaxID=614101 RepID=A0ABQ9HJK2_9NEOP|nr:hypothetical protein PR048_016389 [Dryococelus australis]